MRAAGPQYSRHHRAWYLRVHCLNSAVYLCLMDCRFARRSWSKVSWPRVKGSWPGYSTHQAKILFPIKQFILLASVLDPNLCGSGAWGRSISQSLSKMKNFLLFFETISEHMGLDQKRIRKRNFVKNRNQNNNSGFTTLSLLLHYIGPHLLYLTCS